MNLLLVEDERKLSTLLKQLLEDERYAVDIALDGERAQELAETARYDAIILDLMIPKKDGMEVCRWLRQNRIQTPVIMLTARNQIHDRVAGLDAGADDYLPKPFAFEELLARLRALMRREQKNGHANRLQVADLVLDLKTHQVRRGDTPIELTAREFALLECLLRHPGQVMTRDQLLDLAWPYGVAVTPNAVDAYVHYLRDKLGPAGGQIETVRGVGYRLAAG